jgi:predicted acylesterase/phospholipase RssA
MGGGNSLGTFNGSALTQALKLLLLRGVDKEGVPYRRVEVDVFSGASAGSLSLALMLRELASPDPDRKMAAKVRLIEEFGTEFTRKSKEEKEPLVAAQVLQDLQEEVWVREINLQKLLGTGSPEAARRTRFTSGLLDRRAVEDLARKHLPLPGMEGGKPGPAWEFSERQLLADRVLFASSIANLTPILADASMEFPVHESGRRGLSDGMTSRVHSELRVFDLHFNAVDTDLLTDPDIFPRRWCRYHTGPKVRDTELSGRGIGDIRQSRAWAKIAATSIASAAIPFAFEPVPLERRSYEFGETEGGRASRWPKALRGRDRHTFTYVDGGTFNNEPVREAFRLASFVDAQAPEGGFERLIIFVDPHLSSPDPSFCLPHHQLRMLDRPNRLLGSLDGTDLEKKTTLDRLIPLAGSVIQSITNESRVIEADKVFRTRNRFRIRNVIREELAGALESSPDPAVLASLAVKLRHLLELDRIGTMIPAGALSLEGELRRVLVEEGGPEGTLNTLSSRSPEDVRIFLEDPGAVPGEELGGWLRALTFVAVDRVMDLEGKMEGSQLVAISPATDPSDLSKLEELPGRMANGFGGFMSELAGEHEVELARYCAQLFLEASGRIKEKKLPEKPDFSRNRTQYLKDVQRGLESLEDRMVDVLAGSHVDLLGWIPARILRHLVQGKLAGFGRESVSSTLYELRLEVPNRKFEFDGRGWGDRDQRPTRINGKLYLITFATRQPGKGKVWGGPHVAKGKQRLRVDRRRKGGVAGKSFCTVALPKESTLKKGKTYSYPILTARVKKSDEGGHIQAKRWTIADGVEALDRNILE